MARVAVMVDAGYLIARGAEAITGASGSGRRGVILDEGAAIGALVAFAESKAACPGEILRVYWYDAAGAQPTAEHIRLAELDNVKLRLGTFNSYGEQKGVDSLVIADMIELARNHAVGSFVLVGGDEDLRVGVQVAQTYGIRVHLLGIAIGTNKAQSPGLMREADTNTGWTTADLGAFLAVRPSPPLPAVAPAAPAPIAASAGAPAAFAAPAEARVAAHAAVTSAEMEAAVREFFDLLVPTDLNDIRTVLAAGGGVPQPHDGRLLARTGAGFGRSLDIHEKREMRRIFVRLIEESAPGP